MTLAWMIGFYALLSGIALLSLAFRLRAASHHTATPSPA